MAGSILEEYIAELKDDGITLVLYEDGMAIDVSERKVLEYSNVKPLKNIVLSILDELETEKR